MKRTSFTNLFRSLAVLLLVGFGAFANAQSVSITNQNLGLAACGGAGNNVTSYTFNFPAVAPGANVLGSINLNYCPASWTSDWDFDVISPAGVITNIVNPTGAGAAGGTVNITVLDQTNCNAALPLATTALNSVGSFSGSLRSATPFAGLAIGASAGVWQLRVRNIFTSEPAFLTNATLNFVAPSAYTAAVVAGAVTGGSVVSNVAGAVTSTSISDTLNYTITLSGGSSNVAATATTTFVTPSTAVSNISTVAGPYSVGTTIIREDEVCYANGSRKRVIYRLLVLAPPNIFCPASQVVSLTAGQCCSIAAWNCPTSSIQGTVAPIAPNTQNAAAVGGGIDCGVTGGTNAHGRLYNSFAPAIAAGACVDTTIRITSVVVPVGLAGQAMTVRVHAYSGAFSAPGTAAAPLVYGGNLTLVGSVAFTSVAGSQTVAFPAPGLLAVRGAAYYVEVVAPSGTFSVGYTTVAPGVGPSYISSTACTIGVAIPNPVDLAGAGLAQKVPFTINLAAPLQPVQTAGPVQGTCLVPGVYNITYQATDATNTSTSCSFSITVRPYTAFTNILTCNDLVNISLDATCSATITPDMILNGDNYSCYSDYVVRLSATGNMGTYTRLPTVGSADIGKTLFAQVTDPRTGNSCWGTIKIEDKLAPVITNCGPITIPCTQSIDPVFGGLQTGTLSAAATLTGTSADTIIGVAAGTTNFPIVVSGAPSNAIVSSLSIPLRFSHSFVSDLVVTLIAPDGTSAAILQNQCGGNDNVDATFADANPAAVCATSTSVAGGCSTGVGYTNALTGAIKPFSPLSAFNGKSLNGTWTVRFVDPGFGDAGRLCSATLNFAYSLQLAYAPTFTDGCGIATTTYTDATVNLPCTGGVNTKVITRTWRVCDASNNCSTCAQTINVTRATLANVVCPASLDGIAGRPTLSCDGIKSSVPQPYTVTIPTLVQVPTQHGGWAVDCGSTNVVVSAASGPVQNYSCDVIPFYIDQNGLIVRAKLTPTNVYLPNPSVILYWAKLSNGYPAPTGEVAYLNGAASTGVLITAQNSQNSTENGFVGMRVYRHNIGGVTYYFMGSGEPTGANCGTIGFTYNDSRIDVCGQSFKILREWKILDWCTGAIQTCTQIVKVLDTTGPSIVCPANFTASTDPTVCTGTVVFPAPTLSDNCDAAPTYDLTVPVSLLGIVTRVSAPGATPVVFSGFPIGTNYVITYTATDNCGNTSTCTTLMDVQDLVPPNPICREFTQVALGQNGQTKMAAIRFDAGSYDNCGIVRYQVAREIPAAGACRTSVQANAPTGMGTGLGAPADAMAPFGYTPFRDSAIFFCCDVTDTVNVILRVYDRFVSPGNPSNRFNDCMVQVFVEDKLAPSIVCPPNVTVECGAYDFATNALDSAYMDTYFGSVKNTEAARITRTVNTVNSLGITVPFALKDGIAYDNCDVTIKEVISNNLVTCGSGTINRTFTARDKGGRTISCTQVITVRNLKPFYITDTNPNNNDPQDGVIWPADITLTVCGSQANPDSLAAAGNPNARPTIFEDGCDIVAESYTDEVFVIQAPACFKILRKWSIIDWCAYNDFQSGNVNRTWRWNYTQVIKILNSTAPNFTSGCQNQEFCQTPVNCAPTPITLAVTATDDCTGADGIDYSYTIDPFNDGSAPFISGVGSSITATFPFGTHRITWSAEDGCGNVRTCTYTFKVEECKKPTPICHIALGEIMPSTGMLPISAAHINNTSYDNCAVQYIKVRRTDSGAQACIPDARIPNPPVATGNASADKAALNAWAQQWLVNAQSDGSNADTVIFTCDDRVCGGGVGTLELWVGDNNGNWDYCSTAVTLQNNMNAPGCDQGPGGTGTIAGDVHTELNAMVKDVTLKATSNNPILTALTQTAGTFNWSTVLGGTYTVVPEKDMNPTNGVTTYDLVEISRHILGIKLLDSPYKMIAADVNKSGTITTFDMVQLRKLILRVDANFTNNTSWRFVNAAYVFPDPTNPFANAFPETVTANVIPNAVATAKFMGVKIGDVNNSASSQDLLGTEEHNAVGDLTFNMNDVTAKSGETFTFNVKAKDLSAAQGYQFTMNYNQSAMELVNVAKGELSDLTEANFGIIAEESAITTSWNGKSEGVNPDAVLFSMTFRAKSDLQLSKVLSVSSKITRAEAYTKAGEELNVVFAFNGANGTTIVSENFELFQNTPNPVRNETVIGFNLPTATAATLSIFDVSGKLIKTVEVNGVKGFNQVTLDRTDFKGTGVMKYQLKTANNTATKSMIIVE